MLAKPEWGTKRICHSCGARFYDLRRQPAVCPKCETVQEDEAPARPRRAKATAAADKKPKAAPVAPVEETPEQTDTEVTGSGLGDTAVTDEEDTESGGMIEDASYLGEDDEDMAEVFEHIDAGNDDD